jgi:murein DD-endopeptidase MepM/ murein hydrolase activator NlpD
MNKKSPFTTDYKIIQNFGNKDIWDSVNKKVIKDYYKINYGLFGHNGLDLLPMGKDESIYSIFPGTVMFAGWDTSYGNRIKIWVQELNIVNYYCHLEFINTAIKAGYVIEDRQFIGKMGNTGIGFGAHLHYQIALVDNNCNKLNEDKNNQGCIKGYINPIKYIS